MKTVSFSGYSDDVIVIDGFGKTDLNGVDIDNHYADEAYFLLQCGKTAIGVHGKYNEFGTWHFYPFQLSEDIASPTPLEIIIRIGNMEYSSELFLKIHDATTIEVCTKEELHKLARDGLNYKRDQDLIEQMKSSGIDIDLLSTILPPSYSYGCDGPEYELAKTVERIRGENCTGPS